MMTGAQIRAARILVKWSPQRLARSAGLSLDTVTRAEMIGAEYGITIAQMRSIRSALEAAGIIFVNENDEGGGVRLQKTVS